MSLHQWDRLIKIKIMFLKRDARDIRMTTRQVNRKIAHLVHISHYTILQPK